MRRLSPNLCAITVLCSWLALACRTCPEIPPASPEPQACGYPITVSLANEDREAPAVLMDVSVDSTTLFHGALQPSTGGSYLYINTRVPARGVVLKVVSKTDEGSIEAEKQIWINEGLWIVVTRVRDEGRPPELQISVSYEHSGEHSEIEAAP